MADKCPQCGREAGIATYTCRVPMCHKSRFCCPACICEHMGEHVQERDEAIVILSARLLARHSAPPRPKRSRPDDVTIHVTRETRALLRKLRQADLSDDMTLLRILRQYEEETP